jgi:hypothetical protein
MHGYAISAPALQNFSATPLRLLVLLQAGFPFDEIAS